MLVWSYYICTRLNTIGFLLLHCGGHVDHGSITCCNFDSIGLPDRLGCTLTLKATQTASPGHDSEAACARLVAKVTTGRSHSSEPHTGPPNWYGASRNKACLTILDDRRSGEKRAKCDEADASCPDGQEKIISLLDKHQASSECSVALIYDAHIFTQRLKVGVCERVVGSVVGVAVCWCYYWKVLCGFFGMNTRMVSFQGKNCMVLIRWGPRRYGLKEAQNLISLVSIIGVEEIVKAGMTTSFF